MDQSKSLNNNWPMSHSNVIMHVGHGLGCLSEPVAGNGFVHGTIFLQVISKVATVGKLHKYKKFAVCFDNVCCKRN